MAKDLVEAAARVRALAAPAPQVGVVLGSGLGAFGDSLSGLVKVLYADIPHMPQSSVVVQSGNLCLVKVGEASFACLQGRDPR